MPGQVDQTQTVNAINHVLGTSQPPAAAIADLDTDALSDPQWTCNAFASAVFEQICKLFNAACPSVTYLRNAALPVSFPDKTFVNISMLGEPSALNHNFNILVSGETTYVIQAYSDRAVNIIRRFGSTGFIEKWHALSGAGWQQAYADLFGVVPGVVVPGLADDAIWLERQHVSQ